MTKKELVQSVAQQTQMTQKDTENIVNTVLGTIGDTIAKGENVTIIGFGTFTTTYRAARNGINPKTGALIKINSSTVPKFKAGKKLKEKLVK